MAEPTCCDVLRCAASHIPLRSTVYSQATKGATPLIDPASLKQYDDDRVFEVNGRKCVGSELNGQRAFTTEERKYLDGNRVINPEPLAENRPLDWQVAPDTEVFDGAGVRMGTVSARLKLSDGRHVPVSMFNFGMHKTIDGKTCIYAFSVSINPSVAVTKIAEPKAIEGGVVETSAWLPLDSVVQKDELIKRIGLDKPNLPALPLKDDSFQITGGDPKMYFTDAGEYAIVKTVRQNNAVPSHYLRRPSGTVNLIYSVPGFGLGGQGVDSFLITSGAIFHPAKGVREFVQPTYFPMNDPKAGQVSPMTMTFIYGAVEVPNCDPVYGWIAKEALAPKKP